MNRQSENASEEVAQIGEPEVVFQASRKTLFWGFLLASLPCGLGIAVLIVVLTMLLADWSKDVFGSVVFLAVGGFSLWGGRALWRQTNRLRHLQVVVHARRSSWTALRLS